MRELHLVGFIVSLLALHQLQMFETSLLASSVKKFSNRFIDLRTNNERVTFGGIYC